MPWPTCGATTFSYTRAALETTRLRELDDTDELGEARETQQVVALVEDGGASDEVRGEGGNEIGQQRARRVEIGYRQGGVHHGAVVLDSGAKLEANFEQSVAERRATHSGGGGGWKAARTAR